MRVGYSDCWIFSIDFDRRLYSEFSAEIKLCNF
jgi:hypothetical protein